MHNNNKDGDANGGGDDNSNNNNMTKNRKRGNSYRKNKEIFGQKAHTNTWKLN